MSSIRPIWIAITVTFALLITGCGGNQEAQVAAPLQAGSSNVVLTGSFSGSGPTLFASSSRREVKSQLAGFAFDHIQVSGTLFPGDAGPYSVSNTINITPPKNGVYKASVPFSNVVVHSNEFALLHFVGVAADGSQVYLGDLGGVVNVTASPTTAILTVASTLTFQVLLDLLQNGAVSTYDLDNDATLGQTLTEYISSSGNKPDPATGLFDSGQLSTLFADIQPKFERDATITTSPAIPNGIITVTQDYSSVEELNLQNTLAQFSSDQGYLLNVAIPAIGSAIGHQGGTGSCGGFVDSRLFSKPPNIAVAPASVSSCQIDTGDGSVTIRNIYGGSLLIGAYNLTLPYLGGIVKASGRAPGASNLAISTAQTQQTVAINDPWVFAFGQNFQGPLFVDQYAIASGLLSGTTFSSCAAGFQIPPAYSPTNNQWIVDTFNPFNLPTSDLQSSTPPGTKYSSADSSRSCSGASLPSSRRWRATPVPSSRANNCST